MTSAPHMQADDPSDDLMVIDTCGGGARTTQTSSQIPNSAKTERRVTKDEHASDDATKKEAESLMFKIERQQD